MKRLDFQITKEGLEKLKAQQDSLMNKRPQVLERMSTAREQGDLSENAGYHAAKEELAFIDHRLRELKLLIRSANVIESKQNKVVDLGSVVTVSADGIETTFTIVGRLEADPTNGKLSESSPIGNALLGAKVREQVEITIPDGKITYEIIQIK